MFHWEHLGCGSLLPRVDIGAQVVARHLAFRRLLDSEHAPRRASPPVANGLGGDRPLVCRDEPRKFRRPSGKLNCALERLISFIHGRSKALLSTEVKHCLIPAMPRLGDNQEMLSKVLLDTWNKAML